MAFESTCRMWKVFSHTASQLRPLMVCCPGIFSALSLWVPTLGANVYLVHRYPDTQGKMYTYKGSGNAEFQRTRCPRYAFDFCMCCKLLYSVRISCAALRLQESPFLQSANLQYVNL